MNRPTQSRSKIGCLLALTLSLGLAACGAQDSDAAFSEIALPTFSKDRVAQEAPVEVRRLLSGSGDNEWMFPYMSPSPDGRYLTDIVFADWGSDLTVVDLETGEERSITHDGTSPPYETMAEYSVFSPDGSRIAYAWLVLEGNGGHDEIRSIGVDGSDMKIHCSEECNGDLEVVDWSKDGQNLLVHMNAGAEGDSHIATIDVNTNEYRVLKTVGRTNPAGGFSPSSFFSPDGRFVAFDLRSDPNSRDRDIFLVSTDGGLETGLIQTPGEERLLGWLPDGSGILFHRTADDSRAIWKLPVQAGRPAGPPELVKDDVWQMTGFGFSDDAYFYGVTVSRPGVHTASFDPETGRQLEPLAPLAEPSGPQNGNPAWSPDGTRIAYSERGEDNLSHIIVRSATGELLQDIPVAMDLNVSGLYSAWTAEGFLTLGTSPDGSRGLHLISLESGEARHLGPLRRFGGQGSWTVSEDGSRIFIVPLRRPGGPIIEYEIATDTRRTLELDEHAQAALDRSGSGPWRGSLSPDGD